MRQRRSAERVSSYPTTGRCLECDGPLPRGRRRYCNDAHGLAFWAKHSYNALVAAVLNRDHTCVMCGSQDRLEVDHIIPIADGGVVLDPTNCRTLCHACHVQVTAEWRRSKAEANQRARQEKRWIEGKQLALQQKGLGLPEG